MCTQTPVEVGTKAQNPIKKVSIAVVLERLKRKSISLSDRRVKNI